MNEKYCILSMNPGYDRWHVIKRQPVFPQVFRADEVIKLVSSKGLNVARVFHQLGFEQYTCIDVEGGNLGQLIAQACLKEGLRIKSHPIAEESRINVVVIHEYCRETQTFNEPGPIMGINEVNQLKQLMSCHLTDYPSTALVISGSAPMGFDVDAFADMLSMVRRLGNPLIIDIGGQWLQTAVKGPLSLLKINRAEFNDAFGFDGFAHHEKLSNFKIEHQIDTLIVTDGKNGCMAYDAQNIGYCAKIVGEHGGFCAVGSGDSFLAGYLLGCAKNNPMADCLSLANACGMANTLQYGPAVLTLDDVEMCKKYIAVEKL